MVKYKELSEIELIDLAQKGDEEAINQLMENYKNLIDICINSRDIYISKTIDTDRNDLESIARFKLWKAIEQFNPQNGIKFSTFASTCINNGITDEIKKYTAKKRESNRLSESFELQPREVSNNKTLEEQIIEEEQERIIYKTINDRFGEMDSKIFSDYVSGLAYKDIANKFNITVKKVDNVIQKIKKYFKENPLEE